MNENLESNIESEERQPDETFHFTSNMLNEGLVKSWWEKSKQTNYHVLLAGGIKEPRSGETLMPMSASLFRILTPWKVLRWVQVFYDYHVAPYKYTYIQINGNHLQFIHKHSDYYDKLEA